MDRALESTRTVAEMAAPKKAISRVTTSFPYTKLLFFVFLLSLPLVNPWVRGDGVGYYAYLRSALIDHDLNFENDYLAGNPSFLMGRVDSEGHLLLRLFTKTGYVENHFTVGPAMLWAPVVTAVHLAILTLDRLGASIPADGHSRPYILAMALTTAWYGFLSLLLAFQITRKYFGQQWAFLATVGIWLASSLPVYMYFNPSWSHALSAFGVALFLWYWDRTRGKRTLSQWTILGVIAGLMGNIYYPNVFLLVFPGLEIILLARQRRRGGTEGGVPRSPWLCCGAFGAAFVVSLLPTFVTRQIIYGSPFETGYPGILTWHWTSPALVDVLLSSDHGMWSWTPVLFLAVVGLIFLAKRDALLGAGSIMVFLAYYYFIASYVDWDGLSSYGNRFFVSLTPIFILGFAALLNAFGRWVGKTSRAVAAAGTAIALLAIWNAGFIFQWGVHLVPARGEISWREMIHNQFVVVPDRFTHSMEIYFLHRRDMMHQIEREDIEQQKTRQIQEP
jgi:hypothetical protein